MTFNLLRHQGAMIQCIEKYSDITFFFMIAGFGAGKSTTGCYILMCILHWYKGQYLNFGIGGASIKHLSETLIKDFCAALDRENIVYKNNSQKGIITVGTLSFVYFTMDDPDSIYGWNLAGCVCDEIDELTSEKVKPGLKAVQERCRVMSTKPIGMAQRCPFIICLTTAQGLKGTYLFLNYLDEQKIPYIKIRGRTADNTYIDPAQLRNLEALYTPMERRAYLEGEFVNLTTGRVYAEFDPAQHVYMPFNLTTVETLISGQDFNQGFNANCCTIVRAGIIYVVSTHHWNVMGDCGRQLRMEYPQNPIKMIPDASGKEIMSGFVDEMEESNIDLIWNNANPSITERVLIVNKLFRMKKLYVFADCNDLITALKMRDFDDTGKPRKGHGPDALDHICDAFEYTIWHIVHTINGFDELLDMLGHMGG